MTGPITVETSSKRKQRIENKKKKMAALLDIVKLNEDDRKKVKNCKNAVPAQEGAAGGDTCERVNSRDDSGEENGHSPNKKLKTEVTSEEPDTSPSGNPQLVGAELAELKKMLRERSNKIKSAPKFYLREMGEKAKLTIPLDSRCPLFMSDIQHLLMYSQVGVHSPYSPARWCNLEKYNRLGTTAVLIVENMSIYHYEAFESLFPFTSSNFDHKLEIISPFSHNSDVVKELSMVPITATFMKKLITEYGNLEAAAKNCNEIFDTVNNFFPMSGDQNMDECDQNALGDTLPSTDKFPRTKLMLSGWQMVEENFPLPIKGLVERKYPNYVLTRPCYKSVTPNSPMFALDCEMCRTDTGELELTRISVVDEKHNVLYDTLVKPKNKIVDYLTRFSGINAKMMKTCTTTLEHVHEKLQNMLPDDAILIGQSLTHDLHTLKMMHPYVIDTSVVFNLSGIRSRKTKLKTLAREFLKEKIQTGTQGHCSSEDSLACMKLVQLKLQNTPFFGDAVMNSLFNEHRAYPDMGSANYAVSMLKQCVKVDKTVNVVGVDDLPDQYRFYMDKNKGDMSQISCVKKNTNRDVIKHLCKNMNSHSLNIGHLRIAHEVLEDGTAESREAAFKTLDKWIGEVHKAATQPAFIVVILSGHKEGGNGACFFNMKRDFIM